MFSFLIARFSSHSGILSCCFHVRILSLFTRSDSRFYFRSNFSPALKCIVFNPKVFVNCNSYQRSIAYSIHGTFFRSFQFCAIAWRSLEASAVVAAAAAAVAATPEARESMRPSIKARRFNSCWKFSSRKKMTRCVFGNH